VEELHGARGLHDNSGAILNGTGFASSQGRKVMMLNAGDRLEKVEQRLGTVEDGLGTLAGRVDVLTERVDVLTDRVDTLVGRVDSLGEDVQKLRILEEENARQIKLIAEVQVQHGGVLQQMARDIEPLKAIPDLLKHVVHDHERRITALERRAGS
jgi:polyhydroxyalkanoate synthesis regulator phasin